MAKSRRNGVPRPRGDGPLAAIMRLPLSKGSPPTRGWPGLVRRQRRAARGFPAHAGMARLTRRRPGIGPWVPRPRGDGPLARCRANGPPRGSPPTRGWPRHHEARSYSGNGFPAHAGMARALSARYTRRPGVPRPRGDGPPCCMYRSRPSWGSPPTRGWPFRAAAGGFVDQGFPANAGMALGFGLMTPQQRGFPRPRGDGP